MAIDTISIFNSFGIFVKFFCIPNFKLVSSNYIDFLPTASTFLIRKWIHELNIDLKIVKPRKTKLGDFRFQFNKGFIITINDDLNPFAFLITLTHEIAHAFIYKEYGRNISSHGKEWRNMFKSLMLNFLSKDIFPKDILVLLSMHLIKPTSTTSNDFNLSLILREYDRKKQLTISEIQKGEHFISSNRTFVKGDKLRKRFRCKEIKTNKIYLFNPLANITLVQ